MTPYTITIPAAGVFTIHASGKYFLVTALNGPFSVITSNGDEYDFVETGSAFGNDQAPTFGKLTFYNNTGAPVTITFYVSNSPIKTSDVNVTSTVTATATLTNTLTNCALEAEYQIQAAANVANVANAFTNPGTYFRRAIIVSQKTLDRAANTGNVYIGNSAAHQPITLAPGDVWTIEADTGGKRDLGAWYVQAPNAGDGVSILYA